MIIVDGAAKLAVSIHAPGVVFDLIVENLEGAGVSEASEPGSVVSCDEVEEEGRSLGVAEKAGAVTGVVSELWPGAHGLAEPAVEALGHAVGPGQGRVRRCSIACALQTRSTGCRPVGRAACPSFEPLPKRSVNSEPLSVSRVCGA